jgi:hypothetical protein
MFANMKKKSKILYIYIYIWVVPKPPHRGWLGTLEIAWGWSIHPQTPMGDSTALELLFISYFVFYYYYFTWAEKT